MNSSQESSMAENQENRPAEPHYDPTDDHGNSKELVKPSITITLEADQDPARKQRAKEVLEGFEGEARPPQPDGF
jgi:hypothetical protein